MGVGARRSGAPALGRDRRHIGVGQGVAGGWAAWVRLWWCCGVWGGWRWRAGGRRVAAAGQMG
jgi:hypothetical protein